MTDIVEQLRERTSLGYMADCKCGKCQCVPRELVDRAANGLQAMQQLRAFVGIMFGNGPDAIVPETVPTPLGIPVKLGAIMRAANAALAEGDVSKTNTIVE